MSVSAVNFQSGSMATGTHRAPSAFDPPSTVPELVLARVRALVRRRAAWLERVSNERSRSDGLQLNDVLRSVLDGRDDLELERRWVETEPELASLNEEVGECSRMLKADTHSPLASLSNVFELNEADRDVLQVCLALVLDPGLSLAYAFLQKPFERPFATAALVARLCGWPRETLVDLSRALVNWELVTYVESSSGELPALQLDRHIADVLCGRFELDPVLAGHASVPAATAALPCWPLPDIVRRVRRALESGSGVRIVVVGPRGSGRRSLAASAARELGSAALLVDTASIADADWQRVYIHVQRQALLFGMTPVWYGEALGRRFPHAPASAPVQFVIADVDTNLSLPQGLLEERIEMPRLSIDERAEVWKKLVPASRVWSGDILNRLAERYRLEVGDIASIGRRGVMESDEASQLCRAATRERLGELGQLLDCPFTRDDLIVSDELGEKLDELLFEAKERVRFWENAQARRLFPRGTGLVALMTGTPGTGKTMAAQVIASELGLDLFRIDLATSVSKYIGETAKNLKRIFARASEMNAVLLFDEADALFSKRTDVRDAHDRYANADTNYLLQRLEDFDGIALLSSNKNQNIDSAFVRRIRYVFDFPRPQAAERRRMWMHFIHKLAGDEAARDLAEGSERLAQIVDASGAQIKLAVLSGLFRARREGTRLSLSHLHHGLVRELGKDGRGISPADRTRIGLRG